MHVLFSRIGGGSVALDVGNHALVREFSWSSLFRHGARVIKSSTILKNSPAARVGGRFLVQRAEMVRWGRGWLRERERARKGWIMDSYLLRREL